MGGRRRGCGREHGRGHAWGTFWLWIGFEWGLICTTSAVASTLTSTLTSTITSVLTSTPLYSPLYSPLHCTSSLHLCTAPLHSPLYSPLQGVPWLLSNSTAGELPTIPPSLPISASFAPRDSTGSRRRSLGIGIKTSQAIEREAAAAPAVPVHVEEAEHLRIVTGQELMSSHLMINLEVCAVGTRCMEHQSHNLCLFIVESIRL